MAKDYDFDNDDLDNFDFGDDIDSGFDVDGGERDPQAALLGSLRSSLAKNVLGVGFLKKTMRSALPEGFQGVMDAEEQISSELGSLYNNAGSTLSPVGKIIKKQTRKILPTVSKFIPESLRKKLAEFSEDYEYTPKSQEEYDREDIADTLKDIFASNVEEAARAKAEEVADTRVRDDIESNRFESTAKQLADIRASGRFQQEYLSNITYKFQQKSLELQYRQYFVARDNLALNKEIAPLLKEGLAKIVKNTSLPDIVKERGKEVFKAMAREGIIRKIQTGAVSRMSGAIGRVGENTQKAFKQFFTDFKDNFEMGSDMAETIGDNLDMMGGASGIAGDVAGDLAADSLAARLGKRLSKKVSNSPRLRLMNARLVALNEAVPNALRNFTESDVGERYGPDGERNELLAGGANFVKKMLTGVGGERTQFSIGDESGLEGRTLDWNMAAHRSLTEIIPGYLARILREQQILRTNDPSAPLTAFNLQRGKFTDYATKTRDVARSIIDKEQLSSLRDSIKETIDELDTDGKLSESARADLERQLFTDSLHGYGMDIDRYIAGNRYSKNVSEESRSEISGMFKQKYHSKDRDSTEDKTERMVKRAELMRKFGNVRRDTPDIVDSLETNVSLGNREMLEELGFLVRRNGRSELNLEKLLDLATESDLSYYDADEELDEDSTDYDQSIRGRKLGGPSRRRRRQVAAMRAKRAMRDGIRTARTHDYRKSTKNLKDGLIGKARSKRDQIQNYDYHGEFERRTSPIVERYRSSKNYVLERKEELENLWRKHGVHRWDARRETYEHYKDRLEALVAEGLVTAEEYNDKLSSIATSTSGRIRGAKDNAMRNLKTASNYVQDKVSTTASHLRSNDRTAGVMSQASSIVDRIKARQSSLSERDEIVAIREGVASAIAVAGERAGTVGASMASAGSTVRSSFNERPDLARVKRMASLRARKLKRRVKPIYTGARKRVMLTADGLMSGRYFDSVTRKPITLIEDIVNPVVDIDGTLVVSEADIGAGLSNTPPSIDGDVSGESFQNDSGPLFKSTPGRFIGRRDLETGGRDILNELTGKVFDVYVKGETDPRLKGRVLVKGGYFDKTSGKVIKKISDITGPVLDTEGNEVLSTEDFAKGLWTADRKWGPRLAAMALGTAGKLVKGYAKGAIWYWKTLGKLAFKGVSLLGGSKYRKAQKDEIVDLYFKGDAEPTVYASGMVQNRYFNLSDGSAIRRISDIKGSIADDTGKVIVKESDLDNLVTLNGTPASRFMRGLRNLAVGGVVASIVGMPGVAAYALWKGGKALFAGGRKAFKGLGSLFNRVLGRSKGSKDPEKDYLLKMQRATAEAGLAVFKILEERLPKSAKRKFSDTDGDGLRDGSWQERQKRNREEARGEGEGDGEKSEGGSSLLKGLLGKMTGFGGGEGGWKNTAIGAAGMWLLSKVNAISKWVLSKGKQLLDKPFKKLGDYLKRKGAELLKKGWDVTKNLAKRGAQAAWQWARTSGKRLAMQAGRYAVRQVIRGTLWAGRSIAARVVPAFVAGFGVGLYLNSIKVKWDASKEQNFTKYRIQLYGLNSNSELESSAALSMEKYLSNKTMVNGGKGSLKVEDSDLEEMAQMMGVNPEDKDGMEQWVSWFNDRFTPIYIGYYSAAKASGITGDLTKMETLDTGAQIAISSTIHSFMVRENIYAVRTYNGEQPSLESNATGERIFEQAMHRIKKAGRSHTDIVKDDLTWMKDDIVEKYNSVVPDGLETTLTRAIVGEDKPTAEPKTVAPPKVNPTLTSRLSPSVTQASDQSNRNMRFIAPVAGRITSEYGMRIHPITGVKTFHKGIDFAAKTGDPVYAAEEGVILYQQWMTGYGNVVWIKHDDGKITKYAHLSSFMNWLSPGSRVRQGDQIGFAGNTGASKGSHLHFEIRDGTDKTSKSFDPLSMFGSGENSIRKELAEEKSGLPGDLKSGDELNSDPSEGVDTIASTAKPAIVKDTPNILSPTTTAVNIRDTRDITKTFSDNSKLEDEQRILQLRIKANEKAVERNNKTTDSQLFESMQRTLHKQLLTQVNMDKTLIQTRDLLVEIRDGGLPGSKGSPQTLKVAGTSGMLKEREWTNPINLEKGRM